MPRTDRPASPCHLEPHLTRSTARRTWRLLGALLILVPSLHLAPVAARAVSTGEVDSKGAGASSAASASSAAPGFSLPTRGASTVSLESLKGKVVLVDFWASWCVPCQKAFPWLASLQKQYGEKGLVVVAINLDKKREAAEAFLKKSDVPFVVAFDPSGKTADAYKVMAMPSTYLIGKSGEILLTHVGFDPKKTGEIEALVQKACGE